MPTTKGNTPPWKKSIIENSFSPARSERGRFLSNQIIDDFRRQEQTGNRRHKGR